MDEARPAMPSISTRRALLQLAFSGPSATASSRQQRRPTGGSARGHGKRAAPCESEPGTNGAWRGIRALSRLLGERPVPHLFRQQPGAPQFPTAELQLQLPAGELKPTQKKKRKKKKKKSSDRSTAWPKSCHGQSLPSSSARQPFPGSSSKLGKLRIDGEPKTRLLSLPLREPSKTRRPNKCQSIPCSLRPLTTPNRRLVVRKPASVAVPLFATRNLEPRVSRWIRRAGSGMPVPAHGCDR